jgi:glycoprotein 3-alpha-L-fucosyltransferase
LAGDAIISVRNWDSNPTFDIPQQFIHIVHILESPHVAKNGFLGRANALLASYWRGSDIPTPYHVYIRGNSTENVDENKTSILSRIKTKLKHKTKMAAALISNCESVDRLDYIGELQKHGVGVDIYGYCGQPCPRGLNLNEFCFKMIESKYKFYLAFENSRCEDYITEKLWINALG